jgi:ABC-type branched-subunit amino acid transport system ATPase component
MATPLLETRHLGMRFGGVHAVRDVNFSLAEGELRCLIGPNGAGKSTFFKMVTGQMAPSQGQVLFRGQDISHAQAHEIARLGIGIKTQVPSVFDGLSVRENIWLSANPSIPPDASWPSSMRCWSASALRAQRNASSDNWRTGSGSGSNSASCCRPIRSSSCSMSPPPA